MHRNYARYTFKAIIDCQNDYQHRSLHKFILQEYFLFKHTVLKAALAKGYRAL